MNDSKKRKHDVMLQGAAAVFSFLSRMHARMRPVHVSCAHISRRRSLGSHARAHAPFANWCCARVQRWWAARNTRTAACVSSCNVSALDDGMPVAHRRRRGAYRIR